MRCLCLLLLLCSLTYMYGEAQSDVQTADRISQFGITWTFDKAYPIGTFCNGDYWVVGPVQIVSITNNHHTHGFDPVPGNDGSMLNPGTKGQQGYDKSLRNYNSKLNAGLPNGKAVSADNPLSMPANSSLISSVSWLFKDNNNKEPGCPRLNGGTKAPRPVTKLAAILTCLDATPKPGSFRPGYCSAKDGVQFHVNDLKRDLLPKLKPVKKIPNLSQLIMRTRKPWLDHIHQYMGAMNHPSENMPEYGRELSIEIGKISLALLLDWEAIPDAPEFDKLLIQFVQIGIDFGSIADNGGSWPSNGGHHMGRKWPILFSGLMLDNEHMKNIGQRDTGFQEDLDTFYVSQADIDMTHSNKWKPDKRSKKLAYEEQHLGIPEWGIRHVADPWADNLHWNATYRSINNMAYPGFVLAAHIMGQKKAWNHNPLFDYTDRAIANAQFSKEQNQSKRDLYTFGNAFIADMWRTYRKHYGCEWTPSTKELYATGERTCDDCKENCDTTE